MNGVSQGGMSWCFGKGFGGKMGGVDEWSEEVSGTRRVEGEGVNEMRGVEER